VRVYVYQHVCVCRCVCACVVRVYPSANSVLPLPLPLRVYIFEYLLVSLRIISVISIILELMKDKGWKSKYPTHDYAHPVSHVVQVDILYRVCGVFLYMCDVRCMVCLLRCYARAMRL